MQTTTLTEKQQYWLEHIEAIDKFDGTLKQYAEDHSLVLQDIYSWKSQLRQKGMIEAAPQSSKNNKVKFAKVQSAQPLGSTSFQFRLGNMSISSNTFPDPIWLATFVKEIGFGQ